ncbi:MAG: hypothetical protein NC204_03040 [Candidatus Amulumruptor caecigallinarius]|nr:hypothetical protein [Candidatus Amulumruptor caecigallinarius]
MNAFIKISAVCLSAAVIACGCARRNDSAKEQRENYSRALGDSIEIIKQEIDSCNSVIDSTGKRIAEMLGNFVTVANPREVGSYMIYAPMKNKYPAHSTALMSRINDSEQFELIATLSGKPFDMIRVFVAGASVYSGVVPHDQALNYRSNGITTVLFTGEKADSIGSIIAHHEDDRIIVSYLQGGATADEWILNADCAKMITLTYNLYSANRELNRLERRVPMLHEKINLLRAHLDRRSGK